MRVVLCTQWFPPEKAALLSDIADGLVAEGHEVAVVTGFPNYPTGAVYDGWRQRPWANYRQDGYRLRRVIQYPSHDASAVRRALSYLSFGLASTVFGWRQLRRADVVYVYHPPLTTAFGPWLSRVLGGPPFVLHVQDLWPDSIVASNMIRGRALDTALRVLTRACDAVYSRATSVVCIAPTMATLVERRGIDADRVEVVPNWADEEIFSPSPRDPDLVASLGLSGTTSVMFAGNMGVVQDLETAVRAAAQLSDLPGFRLLLVGDGVLRPALAELAQSLGADNVTFLGARPLEEMNALTAVADAQLVSLQDRPFLRGTIPSKLGSIMASGLPVICSVSGDARELVEASGAGWTCASESVDDMARAFRALYGATPDERRMRGAAGRSFYEANMSKARGVRRLGEILGKAAAAGTPPASSKSRSDKRARPGTGRTAT